MGAAPKTLAAFKIAVGRRGAAFAGREFIRIHRKAHRAAGFAPLKSRGKENRIQPLRFGLFLDEPRARHDHGVDAGRQMIELVIAAAQRNTIVGGSSTTALGGRLAPCCPLRRSQRRGRAASPPRVCASRLCNSIVKLRGGSTALSSDCRGVAHHAMVRARAV